MHPGKRFLIVIWAYGLASFFIAPESAVAGVGRLVFWGMAAIHLIECAVFLPAIRRVEGGIASHLTQVFAFGFLHLQAIGAFAKPDDPKA